MKVKNDTPDTNTLVWIGEHDRTYLNVCGTVHMEEEHDKTYSLCTAVRVAGTSNSARGHMGRHAYLAMHVLILRTHFR